MSVVILLVLLYIISPIRAKEYEISNFDIEMQLTGDGDYLITEEITYNFLEGSYSWASREIPARGFGRLEFISIKGLNLPVTDYQVDDDGDLKLKWFYPETDDQGTFVIKYKVLAGLKSRNNLNIIDWNPIGTGWNVPVKNLDVIIKFPDGVEELRIEPQVNLISLESQAAHFYYDYFPPGQSYHVKVFFRELIPMKRARDYSWLSALIGIVAGIILVLIALISRKRPETVKTELNPEQLSPVGLAWLYYQQGSQHKRGISAAIFSLGRRGKIKLVSKITKGPFKSKKVEVEARIIARDNLAREEEIIIAGLEEHRTLKKFAGDYKLFNRISVTTMESLKEKGLIAQELLIRRKGIYLSSLFYTLPGIAVLGYGLLMESYLTIGVGGGLIIFAGGQLLKGALLPILSGEGFYLKEKIARQLDGKKEELDLMVKQQKAERSLQFFFNELEYIILHKNFTSYTLTKYRKLFKKADDFKLPEWLEFDLSNLDKTLTAMDLVEVIDYFLISTAFIAANTGATATVGAGGSGAGGGGGAAG